MPNNVKKSWLIDAFANNLMSIHLPYAARIERADRVFIVQSCERMNRSESEGGDDEDEEEDDDNEDDEDTTDVVVDDDIVENEKEEEEFGAKKEDGVDCCTLFCVLPF